MALPEPAPEIIMAANGVYWRRYEDSLSMVPVSDDNDPVIGPLAVYKLVGYEDHKQQHRRGRLGMLDEMAQANRLDMQEREVFRRLRQNILDLLNVSGSALSDDTCVALLGAAEGLWQDILRIDARWA